MKANKIYLAFVFLLVLFSCKNNNQNQTNTESQSIVENNEIENHSQTEENHSVSSKRHKESDRFKIIIGDSYEYTYGDNADYSLPATHVYLQMDNYPKVELPTIIGGVSLDLFPSMKEGFEKENTPRKYENIIFEFYTEYADAGGIYIGVFVDNEVQIYVKSITQEDDANPEFHLSQIYEVTQNGLQYFYQRSEDGDYNTYDFSRWQQDFFQPITYSLEQIHQYIADSYSLDTAKDNNTEKGRLTDRFSMFLDYMDAMGMEAPTAKKYSKIFSKIYNEEDFSSPTSNNFDCGYDLTGFDYKTTGKLTNEKLEKYVYTADLTITHIVGESDEKGIYSCKKRIQIVQIDDLLFFDLIKYLPDEE